MAQKKRAMELEKVGVIFKTGFLTPSRKTGRDLSPLELHCAKAGRSQRLPSPAKAWARIEKQTTGTLGAW